MIVQLHGAGFHNYGAWLMMEAVMQELRARLSGIRLEFCAIPNGQSTFEKNAALQLKTILPRGGRRNFLKRYAVTLGEKYISSRWRTNLGLVRQDEVDAIIDVSGFAFGDAWGSDNSVISERRFRSAASQGKPVILLPQMFGPFNDSATRIATKRLMQQVDKVYARDDESLRFAQQVAKSAEQIGRAPDITIFCDGTTSEERPPFICFVPNERVIDKAGKSWDGRYLPTLVDAIRFSIEKLDRDVVLLSHAPGDGDLDLARRLADSVGSDRVQIMSSMSPREAKGLIRQADLLVGSRFHALVAALSSGVPAVAIGWAHKYPALLSDFGVSELNFSHTDSNGHLLELIEACMTEPRKSEIRESLRSSKEKMKTTNEAMWDEVVEIVSSRCLG